MFYGDPKTHAGNELFDALYGRLYGDASKGVEIIHDTRALEENLQYLSIFTPHLPAGTDINWLK